MNDRQRVETGLVRAEQMRNDDRPDEQGQRLDCWPARRLAQARQSVWLAITRRLALSYPPSRRSLLNMPPFGVY